MQRKLQHSYARGAGLVEVLVALVVIAVGMLGVASLYVTTLQAKTTSQSRMQAVNLATDIAERIRANRSAGSSYALASLTAAATDPNKGCIETASATANECSEEDMAATDLYEWSTLVSNTLPGTVTGRITVSGASPATYTITLGWSEPTSSGLSYVLEMQI